MSVVESYISLGDLLSRYINTGKYWQDDNEACFSIQESAVNQIQRELSL